MTIPVWSLFGFTVWTMFLLISTIGVYRWSNILTGRIPITSFRADKVEGADWYRRAMRAHANCIENLPLFGFLVFCLHVAGISSSTIDTAALIVLPARIAQSLIHVMVRETTLTTSVRFAFFMTQFVAFCVMAAPLMGLLRRS